MPLQKELKDLEFTRGLETSSERKRVSPVNLLDLENAVFTGGVPTTRAGGEALPDDTANPDAPLTTALALETVGGELLRWTEADSEYRAGVWTKTEQATTWARRGGEDVARPMLARFESVVSGAASAEAHDCLSLGGLDVVVWTESTAQGQARALHASVRERDTQRVIQLSTVLVTDTTGPGDEVWRLQPRLAQVDSGSLAVFYAIDGDLLCRVLLVASPDAWGAEVALATGVANRVGPRYPFEVDAVGSSSGAVVVWTGTTQGAAIITASSSTGGNPAPALLVDSGSVYTGDITLAVSSTTTMTVTREAVTDVTAGLPVAARYLFGFTGYVQGKITAKPNISLSRSAPVFTPAGGYSPNPSVGYTFNGFTGAITARFYRLPWVEGGSNFGTSPTMRFDEAGYINSFGASGGVIRATVTARFPSDFDTNLPRSARVHVTGPGGYSRTINFMSEQSFPQGGSAEDFHAFPDLGYSFALPDLSASIHTTGQYWEWTFYPLMAEFVLPGAINVHLNSVGAPYYTHDSGAPNALDVCNASGQDLGVRVAFSSSDSGKYWTYDEWLIAGQAGTVAYATNGGSYGSSVALYDSYGTGVAHTVASIITLTWPTEFPTRLHANDVFRLTVATGQFTYRLGAGSTSSPLNIYAGSGLPITHALLSSGSPIGIDARWPNNTAHTAGESWTFTVSNAGRVVRAAVGQSSGVPSVISGPYDLNVNPVDGLTLDKHGDVNLDTTIIFRDRTESEVQAWVFTSALTAVSGPLVLASTGHAAAGLLHVATYLDDTGTVVAILEPTGQYPLEVVFFTQSGVEGSVATFARQLRLLSRPFLVGDRWCVATMWMPSYGGAGGTTVGLQPTAFIIAVDSRNNDGGGLVGRLLAGNAAPLLSSGLPKTLATAEGTARFLVPHRTRLQLQEDGASLVDVSVTGLTAITLSDASSAAFSCVGDEGGLHMGGTLPRYYDGAQFVEDGFAVYPEGVAVVFSSGGSLSAGQYSWQVVYEWTDSRGRRHTSAPSVPVRGAATPSQKATLTVPLLHLTEKREVRLVVYRTEHDGTTHYRTTLLSYVQPDPGSQTADTVELVDGVADAAINTNEILYTDGGELDHFPPPPYTVAAKHLDYLFTNTMEDASGFSWSLPTRLSDGTAWSDAFTSRASGVVSGFSTLDEKLIIFTEAAEYVVLGRGPDVTGANSAFSDFPQLLTGSVGCTNPKSIISTPMGVFHFSPAGLYLLARTLEDLPQGDSVSRYSGLTITHAMLLETVRQVRFYTEEGTTLVFDYSPQVMQWSVFTGQPALDAVVFSTAPHYCTGSKVVRERSTATTEDGEAFSVKVGSAWLKFSSFQGAARVWHCMLLGTVGASATVSASTYYDYDEALHDTKSKLVLGPGAGGSARLQLRHALSKQVCEAFRFVWTFTPTPQSPSDTGKLVLNGMTLEVGVKPGRAKLNNDRNF